MKVQFEGHLCQAEEIAVGNDRLAIDFEGVGGIDVIIGKLYSIERKYVRVTIEEIKEPVRKELPVCYAAMGAA